MNEILIIIVLILAVIAALSCIKHILKQRKHNKEILDATNQQLRDEKLNQVILNNHQAEWNKQKNRMPYEVTYNQKSTEMLSNTDEEMLGQLVIQLIEKTALSSRKYVFSPYKGIRIGSGLDCGNDIVVYDDTTEERQCEIFAIDGEVYVRNFAVKYRSILKRKKKKTIINNQGILLQSGDVIEFGKVSYIITIL